MMAPSIKKNQIVLCCSDEIKLDLLPLVSILENQQIEVAAFIIGENYRENFIEIIHTYGLTCLYVFCESPTVDPKIIKQLQSIATTAEVSSPFQFTIQFSGMYAELLAVQIETQLNKAHEFLTSGYLSAPILDDAITLDNFDVSTLEDDEVALHRMKPSNSDEQRSENSNAPTHQKKLWLSIAAVVVIGIGVALWFTIGSNWLTNDAILTSTESITLVSDNSDNMENDSEQDNLEKENGASKNIEINSENEKLTSIEIHGAEEKTNKEIKEEREPAITKKEEPIEEPQEKTVEESSPKVTEKFISNVIQSGNVRMLDTLLVAWHRHKQLSHEKAQKFCKSLEIEDTSGWHLPTIGQLRSLRFAKMIQRLHYWSSTRADTLGDEMLTLEANLGNIIAKRPSWPHGKTVCVLNIEDKI